MQFGREYLRVAKSKKKSVETFSFPAVALTPPTHLSRDPQDGPTHSFDSG